MTIIRNDKMAHSTEGIKDIILITGATGDIGSRVVEKLLKRGVRPRVFVRDAEKAKRLYGGRVDIVTGDLTNEKSLRPAFSSSDSVLLINTGREIPDRDGIAANAAKAEGVRHLVKLSSLDARQGFGTGVWHARGEEAIRARGIGFTFVRPSGFMSNALFWADSIKRHGTLRSCTGEGKIAFIHPDDIAEVVTVVLTTHKYLGESLEITGPEALSYSEMTAKISAAIGKLLVFQPILEEVETKRLKTAGAPDWEIEYHLSIYRAIREGRASVFTDTVERVLGRRPTTFDQWVRENTPAFL